MPAYTSRSGAGLLAMGALVAWLVSTAGARADAAEPSPTSGEDGWISLITDDWRHWQDHDRRIKWAEDARLDPDNPQRLAASPGDTAIVVERQARVAPLITQHSFADCELHLEFMVAKDSNSGVKLHSHYEIQIYDSYDKSGDPHGSDCGGVYPRWQWKDGRFTYLDDGVPPRVNAARPPGQWQTLNVRFRAPRFDPDGKKTENAQFELVTLNDQEIHRSVELKTPTGMVNSADEVATAPLLIQLDHGPVAFRNVRIRPIGGADHSEQTGDADSSGS